MTDLTSRINFPVSVIVAHAVNPVEVNLAPGRYILKEPTINEDVWFRICTPQGGNQAWPAPIVPGETEAEVLLPYWGVPVEVRRGERLYLIAIGGNSTVNIVPVEQFDARDDISRMGV
jgi:hypothetical protein